MKTTMNRVFPSGQNIGRHLLDWSGDPVSSSFGKPEHRGNTSRENILELQIVRPTERQDLFKYATAMKEISGFWEAVVFIGLAVSAVGAVVMAFFTG